VKKRPASFFAIFPRIQYSDVNSFTCWASSKMRTVHGSFFNITICAVLCKYRNTVFHVEKTVFLSWVAQGMTSLIISYKDGHLPTDNTG
jgi:hypothetical protein